LSGQDSSSVTIEIGQRDVGALFGKANANGTTYVRISPPDINATFPSNLAAPR
jgi:hypothetical protein